MSRKFYWLEERLQQFEREEWGTNDWGEIQEKIRAEDPSNRQKLLTGMEEEQADWDEGDDDYEPHWGID